MKNPFKRDAAAARARAHAAKAAAEARIEELQRDREAALVASDDLDAVRAIDRSIEEQRRAAAIHADRVAALTGEMKRERLAQLARERDAACAALTAARQECVATGEQLEIAIKRVGELYFAARDIRSTLLARWPNGLPFPRANELQLTSLPAEVGYALWAAGRPTARTGCQLPWPQSTTPVAGLGAVGIAALIARSVDSTIARLKSAPLEDDEQEEIAA
jgi:hypothetical protein